MKNIKRIAIAIGSGYTPGLNSIIMGAAISAHNAGWEVVGIRDGFEGLLFPEKFPNRGLIDLGPEVYRQTKSNGQRCHGHGGNC